VTFGGGMTMLNGRPSARGSNTPADTQPSYSRSSTSAGWYCAESSRRWVVEVSVTMRVYGANRVGCRQVHALYLAMCQPTGVPVGAVVRVATGAQSAEARCGPIRDNR
jgi:hypothetical protein